MGNSDLDTIFDRYRQAFLEGTAKSDDEALQNPIENFRFVITGFERVDPTTARILLRFAEVPDIVAPFVNSTDTRVAILSSFVDKDGNIVAAQEPYADLEEFIGTGRVNNEIIIGTDPDGTVIVDARGEL